MLMAGVIVSIDCSSYGLIIIGQLVGLFFHKTIKTICERCWAQKERAGVETVL